MIKYQNLKLIGLDQDIKQLNHNTKASESSIIHSRSKRVVSSTTWEVMPLAGWQGEFLTNTLSI